MPTRNVATRVPKNSRLYVSIRKLLRERLVHGYEHPLQTEAYYGAEGSWAGYVAVRILDKPVTDILIFDKRLSKVETIDPRQNAIDYTDGGTWVTDPSELGVDTRSGVSLYESPFGKWPPRMMAKFGPSHKEIMRDWRSKQFDKAYEAKSLLVNAVAKATHGTGYTGMTKTGFIKIVMMPHIDYDKWVLHGDRAFYINDRAAEEFRGVLLSRLDELSDVLGVRLAPLKNERGAHTTIQFSKVVSAAMIAESVPAFERLLAKIYNQAFKAAEVPFRKLHMDLYGDEARKEGFSVYRYGTV